MYVHVLNSCFNMMGRVQLMPLFLSGNLTSTVFHKYRLYSQHKRSGFPVGTCDSDTAAADHDHDGRRDSNVYEVNPPVAVAVWTWQAAPGWSVS